jgi:formate hydrogenlyase transcriptional activator
VRLNIGSRLTLCFVLIILSMLGGDGVVLWQFHLVQTQAERLNGFDQKLVAILRVHTSLLAFHDRLEALADSKDAGQLVAEAGPLHAAFLSETQRAESALRSVPSDPQQDPSILPTLEVIQGSLQSQLDAVTGLATAGDWSAVHTRLATEVYPLESLTSSLVEKVDREVGEEQAQTILNIKRVEQRVFLLVPVTVVLTLLLAGTLGLSITRSISRPLAQLVEGSRRLARGDFQHQVPVIGDDELAHLGQVFNQTARQLRDLYVSLQSSEDQLRRVINTIPALVNSALPDGSLDFVNERMVEYTGSSMGNLSGWNWSEIVHPDDLASQAAAWRKALERGQPMEAEVRMRRADGEYRWFLARNVPLRDDLGNIVRWYGTTIDIEDRKRVEAQLQRSEAYLAEAQQLSHTGSFGRNLSSGEIYWSDETYRIYEFDRSVKPTLELVFERIHPDDRHHVQQALNHVIYENIDFDLEHRLLMPGGGLKHVRVMVRALKTSAGDLGYVGAVTDVTAAKQAGEALRRSESYLAEAQRLTHTGSGAWRVPGWDALYLSEEWYRIYGFDPNQGMSAWEDRLQRIHPEDQAKVQEAKDRATSEESDYEVDHRIVLPDGTVKYTHTVGHPVFNASGDLEQFVCTMMDITERKQAEEALRKAFEEIKGLKDQLYRENIALKEEVDQAWMFDEIVGNSPALRAVLSRISKVAPVDSTVLITGETGTGKELIARAVHKRSRRSARAFVSVNCAAIPRDLIASELFGHEKGAFTGAIQRRLGRFELAEGGTIFLDEIGELPAETQIALLRVLQEHEFERVGGTGSIQTNARVIAATNRDLQAAIAAGTFRSDLFYRLNVFPIEVPSLRERRGDIPVLVGYFIDRFARRAGKSIRSVDKTTMELLQSYRWPGNIRELQNVIERSVIVCDTERFSVDESWLSPPPVASKPKSQPELSRTLADREREMIEAALRESGGRVSGPSGAAVRLGIPGSTLDSKIRSLKIDKNLFKSRNHYEN